MKSKAPLALIEQAIMLLVFALSAALCLRAFVWADTQSQRSSAQDQAILQVQNAAETLKSTCGDFPAAAQSYGGHWDGNVWTVQYDAQWNQVSERGTYRLQALPVSTDTNYLGCAEVEVCDAGRTTLVRLTVCWQEVAP